MTLWRDIVAPFYIWGRGAPHPWKGTVFCFFLHSNACKNLVARKRVENRTDQKRNLSLDSAIAHSLSLAICGHSRSGDPAAAGTGAADSLGGDQRERETAMLPATRWFLMPPGPGDFGWADAAGEVGSWRAAVR